ncbi:MAG: hypothetical protein JO086_08015, partial [Acidimicrobiia bacterium]|nr:hypothetical protein [Acidimicrobiia bacterium]
DRGGRLRVGCGPIGAGGRRVERRHGTDGWRRTDPRRRHRLRYPGADAVAAAARR